MFQVFIVEKNYVSFLSSKTLRQPNQTADEIKTLMVDYTPLFYEHSMTWIDQNWTPNGQNSKTEY